MQSNDPEGARRGAARESIAPESVVFLFFINFSVKNIKNKTFFTDKAALILREQNSRATESKPAERARPCAFFTKGIRETLYRSVWRIDVAN